jgi:hypothetical protein
VRPCIAAAGRKISKSNENKNRDGNFAKMHLRKNVNCKATYFIPLPSQLNACMHVFLQMRLWKPNMHW